MSLLRSIFPFGRAPKPVECRPADGGACLVPLPKGTPPLVLPPAYMDDVFTGLPGVDEATRAHLGDIQRGDAELDPHELLALLDQTLLEMETPELTELHEHLVEAARSIGAYATPNTKVKGAPATVQDIIAILTGATAVPTTLQEVSWALTDLRRTRTRVEYTRKAMMGSNGVDLRLDDPRLSIGAVEAHAELLQAREEELLHYETLLKAGVDVYRPEPWPTDVRSARAQRSKCAAQISKVERQLKGKLRRKPTEIEARALHRHLESLQERKAHLDFLFEGLQGIAQRDFLDNNSYTVGVSAGPGIPGAFAATRDIGVRFMPADRKTGERDLDVYRGYNLSTPVASGGYVKSKEVDGFNYSFSFPYFSLFNSRLHGRGVRLFIPGLFSFSLSDTGTIGIWAGLPIPIPGLVVGVTVNVRNPKLARFTAPPVHLVDAAWQRTKGAVHPSGKGNDEQLHFPKYTSSLASKADPALLPALREEAPAEAAGAPPAPKPASPSAPASASAPSTALPPEITVWDAEKGPSATPHPLAAKLLALD